ncbi:MAG: tyrosine--tRNA ligase, partial [Actinobacteria bacterium]|nr:tyrosine--tRNA ligase [Actinomycetota bacterium]
RRVARAIVALYHGEAAARGAETAFDRRFKEHRAPDEMPAASIPPGTIEDGQVFLPRMLAELGLAQSGSEARRLIAQGGVRINGRPVAAEECPVEALVGATLQVGKRRFVRLS